MFGDFIKAKETDSYQEKYRRTLAPFWSTHHITEVHPTLVTINRQKQFIDSSGDSDSQLPSPLSRQSQPLLRFISPREKDDGVNSLISQSALYSISCVIFRKLLNLCVLRVPPEKTASRPPHSTQQVLFANNVRKVYFQYCLADTLQDITWMVHA